MEKPCKFENCPFPCVCKGYCEPHYTQFRRGKQLVAIRPGKKKTRDRRVCLQCSKEFEVKRSVKRFLCSQACKKIYQIVDPRNKNWRHDNHGYLICRQEIRGKYPIYKQHRIILEDYLGRKLLSTEHIHHINKIKDDNRIENFILFVSNSAHQRFESWGDNGVKPEEILFDGRLLIDNTF